jgi:membrane protein implicated in regulation of membrane protease activity
MSDYVLWWLLAGGAVVLELLTGTFYLLMLALGLAAGALAAHAGFGLSAQLLVSALAGSGAVMAWHLYRGKHPQGAPAQANPDVNLDVGSIVHIEDAGSWTAEGTATVRYRGAEWAAELASGSPACAGQFTIEQVRGSVLVLRHI